MHVTIAKGGQQTGNVTIYFMVSFSVPIMMPEIQIRQSRNIEVDSSLMDDSALDLIVTGMC